MNGQESGILLTFFFFRHDLICTVQILTIWKPRRGIPIVTACFKESCNALQNVASSLKVMNFTKSLFMIFVFSLLSNGFKSLVTVHWIQMDLVGRKE